MHAAVYAAPGPAAASGASQAAAVSGTVRAVGVLHRRAKTRRAIALQSALQVTPNRGWGRLRAYLMVQNCTRVVLLPLVFALGLALMAKLYNGRIAANVEEFFAADVSYLYRHDQYNGELRSLEAGSSTANDVRGVCDAILGVLRTPSSVPLLGYVVPLRSIRVSSAQRVRAPCAGLPGFSCPDLRPAAPSSAFVNLSDAAAACPAALFASTADSIELELPFLHTPVQDATGGGAARLAAHTRHLGLNDVLHHPLWTGPRALWLRVRTGFSPDRAGLFTPRLRATLLPSAADIDLFLLLFLAVGAPVVALFLALEGYAFYLDGVRLPLLAGEWTACAAFSSAWGLNPALTLWALARAALARYLGAYTSLLEAGTVGSFLLCAATLRRTAAAWADLAAAALPGGAADLAAASADAARRGPLFDGLRAVADGKGDLEVACGILLLCTGLRAVEAVFVELPGLSGRASSASAAARTMRAAAAAALRFVGYMGCILGCFAAMAALAFGREQEYSTVVGALMKTTLLGLGDLDWASLEDATDVGALHAVARGAFFFGILFTILVTAMNVLIGLIADGFSAIRERDAAETRVRRLVISLRAGTHRVPVLVRRGRLCGCPSSFVFHYVPQQATERDSGHEAGPAPAGAGTGAAPPRIFTGAAVAPAGESDEGGEADGGPQSGSAAGAEAAPPRAAWPIHEGTRSDGGSGSGGGSGGGGCGDGEDLLGAAVDGKDATRGSARLRVTVPLETLALAHRLLRAVYDGVLRGDLAVEESVLDEAALRRYTSPRGANFATEDAYTAGYLRRAFDAKHHPLVRQRVDALVAVLLGGLGETLHMPQRARTLRQDAARAHAEGPIESPTAGLFPGADRDDSLRFREALGVGGGAEGEQEDSDQQRRRSLLQRTRTGLGRSLCDDCGALLLSTEHNEALLALVVLLRGRNALDAPPTLIDRLCALLLPLAELFFPSHLS